MERVDVLPICARAILLLTRLVFLFLSPTTFSLSEKKSTSQVLYRIRVYTLLYGVQNNVAKKKKKGRAVAAGGTP